MKITHTISHTIKFSVKDFINTEGGMDVDTYGKEVDSLEEALHLFELAKVHSPESQWLIVGEVTTTLNPTKK